MSTNSRIRTFFYGHYYSKYPVDYNRIVQNWIRDVDDKAYPILIDVLGFEPEINQYIVEFRDFDIAGFYAGIRNVDGISGGYIGLHRNLLDNLREYPKNLEGGLVYETIHGFLQPLKFRPNWRNVTILNTDESFDIIFEVEFDERIGLDDFINQLYNRHYHRSSATSGYIYFSLLWDIREKFGWDPIQRFFKLLKNSDTPLVIEGDVNEFYNIINSLIDADIQPFFKKHGFLL